MQVTKLLISPVKKKIFCPKTTKFGPKLAFLVNLGQAMQPYSVPCWWVGWWLWRAGCISQDTYLLYSVHTCVTCFSKRNNEKIVLCLNTTALHHCNVNNLRFWLFFAPLVALGGTSVLGDFILLRGTISILRTFLGGTLRKNTLYIYRFITCKV